MASIITQHPKSHSTHDSTQLVCYHWGKLAIIILTTAAVSAFVV